MSRNDDPGTAGANTGIRAGDMPSITEDAEPDEQVAEIRESIEQTRSEMSETIDALQERLSPAHLKDQVREQVREQYEQAKQTVRDATVGKVEHMVERVSDSMYETRRGVVETVQANPIPAALVGIGLAWLWMNRSGSRSGGTGHRDERRSSSGYGDLGRYSSGESSAYGYEGGRARSGRSSFGDDSGAMRRAAETASGVASRVQDTARNLAGRAKETVGDMVGSAQDTAGEWVDQAQHQARRVESRVGSMLQESPLALGAVALALGTAVGLAAPRTRPEDELMGAARDTVMEKAQSVAHDTMEHVQEVAQKVTDGMSSTGSDRSGAGQQGGAI